MISSTVFMRYARSLVDVMVARNEETQVSGDLALYGEIFHAVPELLESFHNPAVPRSAKDKILAELMALYPVGPTAANFLRTLLAHNRLRYFNEILDQCTRTLNERKGIVAAKVISATPLSAQEAAALRDGLLRVIGRSVILDVRTDSELLGGLVVQVGSTVFDGSIRRQLEVMRERLADSGSHH